MAAPAAGMIGRIRVLIRQSFLLLLPGIPPGMSPELYFSGLTASSGITRDPPGLSAPGILPSGAY